MYLIVMILFVPYVTCSDSQKNVPSCQITFLASLNFSPFCLVEDCLRYAAGLISDYLHPSLSKKMFSDLGYDLTVEEFHPVRALRCEIIYLLLLMCVSLWIHISCSKRTFTLLKSVTFCTISDFLSIL